jgi:3'(2'), 5'-bisphosphate nucleotidase
MNVSDVKHKYPTLVKQICLAATMAGKEILEVYSQDDFGITLKDDKSPLTLADKRADKAICNILAMAFPEIPIVSEESYTGMVEPVNDIFFLVDPLDGTKEFIKRTGEFTVNIALILNGTAELGVVFVPTTHDLYYRDFDGTSHWQRLMLDTGTLVTSTKISCKRIDWKNLTVVKSVSHSTPSTDAYIDKYKPKKCTNAGSSLKFCLIACGMADLYPRLGRTMEWDTAAAHAVLKGAGGNIFSLDVLEELRYGKKGLENPFFIASSNSIPINLLAKSNN